MKNKDFITQVFMNLLSGITDINLIFAQAVITIDNIEFV